MEKRFVLSQFYSEMGNPL